MSSAILLPYSPRMIRVPVYGQIAAGTPLQDTTVTGWRWIRAPQNCKPTDRICAVRINGDSLIEEMIKSGDYAICRLTPQLDRNGQLAAVLIPEGVTLKFVWFERGRVRLAARNAAYRDRWFDLEDVTVQAVVVRIERDY